MQKPPPQLSANPVFYDTRMIADAHSYSPSAGKPRDVVESWKALGIPLTFKHFEPISRDEFALAYSRRYEDDILDGRADNGFGNRLPTVASSLPWTSGAMLAAAREALSNGQVAVAPVAGSHHAQYDSAAGYSAKIGTATIPHESVDRPHWQPLDYNALHGGIERRFAGVVPSTLQHPLLRGWVQGLARVFVRVAGHPLPYCEVHQFRIDTADGIGRPTPEGAHRDGVDYVVVLLIARHAVRGGETRVFDAHGPAGLRFTMRDPATALLLDDHRMIHETTPLQPDGTAGHRDTLVLTFRRDGFLDPPR